MDTQRERLVVWRCPECGWYWVDSDTIEDGPADCDKDHGKMERVEVLPAAHLFRLEEALGEAHEVIDTFLKWAVNDWDWSQEDYDQGNALRSKIETLLGSPSREAS